MKVYKLTLKKRDGSIIYDHILAESETHALIAYSNHVRDYSAPGKLIRIDEAIETIIIPM